MEISIEDSAIWLLLATKKKNIFILEANDWERTHAKWGVWVWVPAALVP
jgi:hypothetical protein